MYTYNMCGCVHTVPTIPLLLAFVGTHSSGVLLEKSYCIEFISSHSQPLDYHYKAATPIDRRHQRK